MTTETQVTESEFFAKMGPLDVHPRVMKDTLSERWHVSEWVLQRTHQVIGRSESDSRCAEPWKFFLYQ